MGQLTEKDFTVASLRTPRPQPFVWGVGRYELREGTIVDVSSQNLTEQKVYKPLEDEPDMFFRFASLCEVEDFASEALQWVNKYGLLETSGALDELLEIESSRSLEDDPSWRPDPQALEYASKLMSEAKGTRAHTCQTSGESKNSKWEPPSMTLEELHRLAYDAWEVLALYEASLNHDATRLLYGPDSSTYPGFTGRPFLNNMGVKETARWLIEHGQAKLLAADKVANMVAERCRLWPLNKELGTASSGHPSVRFAWGFRDLLGAMYLQMMWVLQRGVNIGRCKWCNKPIPPRHPVKDGHGNTTGRQGRKVRNNKTFCNSACRMQHKRARDLRSQNGS